MWQGVQPLPTADSVAKRLSTESHLSMVYPPSVCWPRSAHESMTSKSKTLLELIGCGIGRIEKIVTNSICFRKRADALNSAVFLAGRLMQPFGAMRDAAYIGGQVGAYKEEGLLHVTFLAYCTARPSHSVRSEDMLIRDSSLRATGQDPVA